MQREVTAAARRNKVGKRVICHAFRHVCATRLLKVGDDARAVQELLGQRDVSTTMIHTHVLQEVRGVRVARRMRCSALMASGRCRHGTNCSGRRSLQDCADVQACEARC